MFRAVSLLVLLGIIWGSGYSIARYAMTHGVFPLGYSFWQAWGPAIFLVIFLKLKKIRFHFSKDYITYYIITGLLGIAIPNTVMYITAAHLPAGILAIVVNTVPIIAYPMALAVAEERFDSLRLLGVGIGVAGMLCIALPKSGLSGAHFSYWALIALISPLCFASCAIFGSKFRPQDSNSICLSTGMLLTAAILLTPIVFSFHEFYALTPPYSIAKLVVLLEIVLSSIGYILFFELLKVAGPVYYSLVGGLTGLTGLFWGRIIFNEHFDYWTIFAVILILAAIVLVTIKRRAFTHKKPKTAG